MTPNKGIFTNAVENIFSGVSSNQIKRNCNNEFNIKKQNNNIAI